MEWGALNTLVAVVVAILTPLAGGNIFFIKNLIGEIHEANTMIQELKTDVAVLKYAVEDFRKILKTREI